MKLTKISLAALVALGGLTSVASATPLEETIKNVDLSGWARYRYTHNLLKNKGSDAVRLPGTGHQFKSILGLKTKIDDNFAAALKLRYVATDASGGFNNTTNTTTPFGVYEAYMTYTAGNTTVQAGKQVLNSFYTDDSAGTGLAIVNKDIENLTLVAAFYDALETTDGDYAGGIDLFDNLYGVAFKFDNKQVNFMANYFVASRVAKLIGVEAGADFAVSDDANVGFKAQFVDVSPEKQLKDLGAKAGDYYGVELSGKVAGADVTAGVFGWKVKDKGLTTFVLEDHGKLFNPGEQTGDQVNTLNQAENQALFGYLTGAYKLENGFGLGADFVFGSAKDSQDSKLTSLEIVPRVSYAYSKKLNFSGFYSYLNMNPKDGDSYSYNRFRFEAKYSF